MQDSPASILYDTAGNAVSVQLDGVDGLRRLAIVGKVSVAAPGAPPSTTAVVLANDSPLAITSTRDTFYVIPNGQTFTLQFVAGGSEGDPSEKGSVVEVHYDDVGTFRVVERLYVTAQTVSIYPDTSKTRDGTAMTGNAGGTKRIRLRRRRLSGASQEVDAVIRGYVV